MLELGPKILKKFGMFFFILSNSFFFLLGEGKNAFIFKR